MPKNHICISVSPVWLPADNIWKFTMDAYLTNINTNAFLGSTAEVNSSRPRSYSAPSWLTESVVFDDVYTSEQQDMDEDIQEERVSEQQLNIRNVVCYLIVIGIILMSFISIIILINDSITSNIHPFVFGWCCAISIGLFICLLLFMNDIADVLCVQGDVIADIVQNYIIDDKKNK